MFLKSQPLPVLLVRRQRPSTIRSNIKMITSMKISTMALLILLLWMVILPSSPMAFVLKIPSTTQRTSPLSSSWSFTSSFQKSTTADVATSSSLIRTMQPTPTMRDNDDDDDDQMDKERTDMKTTQPTPVMWSFINQALQKSNSNSRNHTNNNNIATTTMAAATILLSTLFVSLSYSLPADAAMSGGRMGGSFSRSSSGGGGSRMRMASPGSGSRSYYSGGGGYNNYYGGGLLPRTTIVAPIISPFYNPIVPYYGGGVGAISYARGPGLFDLLFLGGIGFFVLSAISNTISSATQTSSSFGGQWDDSRDGSSNLFAAAAPTTVFKCNVALDVPNRDDPNSILSVLDRMAKVTAKTDTRKGVITLTKQVALELLRRKSSIYSAAGMVQQFKNDKDAQRTYNQWSIQERSKFEQENVNKFNKFDLSLVKTKDVYNTNRDLSSSSKATMAVVTLVVSLDGSAAMMNIKNMKHIQSLSDLELILQAIASMSSSSENDNLLYGAEILWTPEDRTETLTKKDILADYPELNVL